MCCFNDDIEALRLLQWYVLVVVERQKLSEQKSFLLAQGRPVVVSLNKMIQMIAGLSEEQAKKQIFIRPYGLVVDSMVTYVTSRR